MAPDDNPNAAGKMQGAQDAAPLASQIEIFLLVLFLGLIFLVLATGLIGLWPQPMTQVNAEGIPIPVTTPEGQPVWKTQISFLGTWLGDIDNEVRLFALVVIAGFLGSFIHVAVSVADYIGNRKLSRSWIYWYLLRLPVGASLAAVFYLLVRGGVLTGAASSTQLQPYGIVGISALAGLFSKQATDKLREVFETLFRTEKGDTERGDKLAPKPPILEKVEPEEINKGDENVTLVLRGRNFLVASRVEVNQSRMVPEFRSETELRLTLGRDVWAGAQTLAVRVVTPGPDGGVSDTRKVQVA
ncbi:MAG: hypothetical protein R3245_12505 [Kiloniellales bacterium]|nr:hypothetical protein [Kiloniellales bacterium]